MGLVPFPKHPWDHCPLGNGPYSPSTGSSRTSLHLLLGSRGSTARAKVPRKCWVQPGTGSKRWTYFVAANGKTELRESPGVRPIRGAASPCTEGGFHPVASVHPVHSSHGHGEGLPGERPPKPRSHSHGQGKSEGSASPAATWPASLPPPSLPPSTTFLAAEFLPCLHPSIHPSIHPSLTPSIYPPAFPPSLPPSLSLCRCRGVRDGAEMAPSQAGAFGYSKVTDTTGL